MVRALWCQGFSSHQGRRDEAAQLYESAPQVPLPGSQGSVKHEERELIKDKVPASSGRDADNPIRTEVILALVAVLAIMNALKVSCVLKIGILTSQFRARRKYREELRKSKTRRSPLVRQTSADMAEQRGC
jgi:hypothetical protein